MLVLMPPLRGSIECLVVAVFGALYQTLKRNVTRNLVFLTIEEQNSQQTNHTSIPIKEGMNTQKIEYVECNNN